MEKEIDTEDWCFICKDGGDLLLCDNVNCPKVYHSGCLQNEGHSTSQLQQNWTCDCHSCTICKETSEVNCFCCPNSFCQNCLQSVEFAPLRHNKGLCKECWGLVLLAHNNFTSSSIQTNKRKLVDFEDRDTYECLFKEYWEIVKEKQAITSTDLALAKSFLHNKKQKRRRTQTGIHKMGEDLIIRSSSTEDDDAHAHAHSHSHSHDDSDHEHEYNKKIVKKVNKSDHPLSFSGWGSEPLVHFLNTLGIDHATQQPSLYDVSSTIFNYIREKDLIHPLKKKKFMCDKNLHAIFRKNTVSIKQIDRLLKPHFSNSQTYNGSKRRPEFVPSATNVESKDKPREEKGYYASVVADNIRQVYLKRSLVEDLLKQPENFEDKVVGSFIKLERERSKGKNSHQLLQVIGVKKVSSADEINGRNVVLHVCTLVHIQISMLSDSDLTEEDCENLRGNIANGLLQRPTVEEIKKKARILRQDIMKRWIERELIILQNRIDHANEKGRRSELYQLIEQRENLKKLPEQERLLKQVPTVIADLLEPMPTSSDSLSPS